MVYSRQGMLDDLANGIVHKYYPFYGHSPSIPGLIDDCCFSQWFIRDFECDGQVYCCMEQYMMACKARIFKDEDILEKIMQATYPGDMKRLGRQVSGFDSDTWNKECTRIVLYGNLRKFTANPDLWKILDSTGDRIIVEAAPRDTIWGIGLGKNNPRVQDPREWRGQNRLGFCLTAVRDTIRRLGTEL